MNIFKNKFAFVDVIITKGVLLILILLVAQLITLNVSAAVSKVTELYWDIPTTKADGTVLDDMAGTLITCDRYNTTPISTWTYTTNITDATTNSLLLSVWSTSRVPTEAYCIVQIYNSTGEYSAYSNVVQFRRTGLNAYEIGTINSEPGISTLVVR